VENKALTFFYSRVLFEVALKAPCVAGCAGRTPPTKRILASLRALQGALTLYPKLINIEMIELVGSRALCEPVADTR
jgi:hypothetical protein